VSLKDRLSSLDRLQQTRTFKLVASGALVVLALAAVIAYVVAVNAPPSNATPTPATLVQESADNAEVGPESLPPDATPEQKAAAERAAEARSALDATAKSIEGVLSARTDPLGVATGALVGLGLALAVVWLGIGLTYLGLILGVGLIAPSPNDEFVPGRHEAVMQQPADGIQPGRVVACFQPGYTLAIPGGTERVLRPAKVAVSPAS
jgi:hypothetical protein